MKLEEGMYVRLDTGKIGKVVYFKEKDSYPYSYDRITIDSERYTRTTRNVIKASHNIIDLIEVGDYLNGFKVSKIERYDTNTIIKIGNSTFNVLENEEIYTPSYDNNNGYEKIEKLKSILTHEQMEQMAYKVVE